MGLGFRVMYIFGLRDRVLRLSHGIWQDGPRSKVFDFLPFTCARRSFLQVYLR